MRPCCGGCRAEAERQSKIGGQKRQARQEGCCCRPGRASLQMVLREAENRRRRAGGQEPPQVDTSTSSAAAQGAAPPEEWPSVARSLRCPRGEARAESRQCSQRSSPPTLGARSPTTPADRAGAPGPPRWSRGTSPNVRCQGEPAMDGLSHGGKVPGTDSCTAAKSVPWRAPAFERLIQFRPVAA